jgi:hypothetical protein
MLRARVNKFQALVSQLTAEAAADKIQLETTKQQNAARVNSTAEAREQLATKRLQLAASEKNLDTSK